MKTRKESFMHKLGDKIERVGERITNMGYAKLGRKVYNFGNKIEHSRDTTI